MKHHSFQFSKKGQALIESIAMVTLGLFILLLFINSVRKFNQTTRLIEKANREVRHAKSN